LQSYAKLRAATPSQTVFGRRGLHLVFDATMSLAEFALPMPVTIGSLPAPQASTQLQRDHTHRYLYLFDWTADE
jgi:hypothetical protein